MAAKKKSAKKAVKKAVKTMAKKTSKRAAPRSKSRKVPPIPKGFHTITPLLSFVDPDKALAFYSEAFGAKELYRLTGPSGRIGHAEMRIGDSLVMMSGEYPEMNIRSAESYGGSPVRLSIAHKDVDGLIARAVAAGATVVRPATDEFYGWRNGTVSDPFGYHWFITKQIEIVSPRQMQKRWDKMMSAPQDG